MTDLSAFWSTYGGAVTGAIGGIGGWYANMTRTRLDAGQQALMREARMDRLLGDLTDRIAGLMRQRWQSDDALQDIYAQAISARLTIQELDAQAGRPPRVFPPLPPYPYSPADRKGAGDNEPAVRTVAGTTSDPRAPAS